MLFCPIVQRSKETLVRQFRKGFSPIMPNRGRKGPGIADQCRQVGHELVTSSRAKLLHQIGSPIGSVILQAVAKDCIRRLVAERLQQSVSDCVEGSFDRVAIVVIQYKTLGSTSP